MNWIAGLFRRRRRYDDLSVSIQEHIAERADEFMSEGLPPAEAERMARREFGNVSLTEQRSREVWQLPALESIVADLKFVFRRLRKSPGFAATVLATLAIGIGANVAVFSVLNSVILKPLPYPEPDRLVSLNLDAPGAEGLASFESGLRLSASMYFTFSEHNRTFQSLGVWIPGTSNVTGFTQPEEVKAVNLTDGVLETLGVPPMLGRSLSADDQDPKNANNIMLSYGYWQRRFGGDRSVIGQSITVDSRQRTIIGVMPRSFRFVDQDFDILAPMGLDPHNQSLAGFGLLGIGRLNPDVTIGQADADVGRLIKLWMDSWTNGPGTNPHWYEQWRITPAFRPLKQAVVGDVSELLWVVMGTIGVVMLIACTNVANLLLVRAESRQQELSIRAALGAGRARIARELLVESLALGLIGGLLAIGVAYGGLRLLVAIGPTDLPRLTEISLDARSLLFTLLLSVFSGLFFGAIPALKYAGARVRNVFSGAARTASAGRDRQRVRKTLVVAQVAMALVLLVSAVLMIRTFWRLRNVDPGFSDAHHLQTLRISVPDSLVSDQVAVTRLQNAIADKLAAIPGVTSVGFAEGVPMDGIDPWWDEVRFEGKSDNHDHPPMRLFNFVSPNYFHTMGTRMVAGRDFTWTDVYGLRPVAMLSEGFARTEFGSPSAAVGKRFRQFANMPWQEIVGVVQDVHHDGVSADPPAIVYWPSMMSNPYLKDGIRAPRAVTFAIHTSRAGTESFLAEIQQAVGQVNSSLPVASPRTMQEIYSKSLARTSFTLVMLAIAGSMALTLGILGIYGVISYTVAQRTREIGIRVALGAQKSELKWMFVRSALVLTGFGVGLGVCAAAGLMRLMKSLLFGISPLDPFTYIAIPLVLLASAALASYLPARRAASIDPVDALRAD
jgi:putative ABC transport system permease protein